MTRGKLAWVVRHGWLPGLVLGSWMAGASGCAAGDDGAIVDTSTTPTGTSCVDRCEPGVRTCVTGGYQECVLDGACYDWGPVVPCPGGSTCVSGTCQSGCTSECTEGSARCTATGIQTCELDSGSGCWLWGADTPCPDDETCSAGKCSSECVDECTDGSRQCDGDGYQLCGNTDADSCLDWGPTTACGANETCSGGYCDTTCSNECTAGSSECVGTAGLHTCGNIDSDPCLEWGAIQPCNYPQTCSNGSCGSTCTDECSTVGDKECTASGDAFRTCQQSGSCKVWGLPTNCQQDEECTDGECVPQCDCDFYMGVCEPDAPGSSTGCACDPDCNGTTPCGADSHCDTWCVSDPDCSCACDYNEYCEAASIGSTDNCACDPDCELNEYACSDDGHCDTWCPSNEDPDCGVDPCRARWMEVGYREAHQMFLSGSYTDPDPDEGPPWVLLSPNLSSGSAEMMVEFASEHLACMDQIRIYAWGYDDSLFGDGAEMYFYNWDTFQYDLLPDETIGWIEAWYSNTVTDPSPYILCMGDYCYIAAKIGASSFDNTHLWDADIEVYLSP